MNKISKKIVALATMAAFVLTLVPAAAFAAPGQVDDTTAVVNQGTAANTVNVDIGVGPTDLAELTGGNIVVWVTEGDQELVPGTDVTFGGTTGQEWPGKNAYYYTAQSDLDVTLTFAKAGTYQVHVAVNDQSAGSLADLATKEVTVQNGTYILADASDISTQMSYFYTVDDNVSVAPKTPVAVAFDLADASGNSLDNVLLANNQIVIWATENNTVSDALTVTGGNAESIYSDAYAVDSVEGLNVEFARGGNFTLHAAKAVTGADSISDLEKYQFQYDTGRQTVEVEAEASEVTKVDISNATPVAGEANTFAATLDKVNGAESNTHTVTVYDADGVLRDKDFTVSSSSSALRVTALSMTGAASEDGTIATDRKGQFQINYNATAAGTYKVYLTTEDGFRATLNVTAGDSNRYADKIVANETDTTVDAAQVEVTDNLINAVTYTITDNNGNVITDDQITDGILSKEGCVTGDSDYIKLLANPEKFHGKATDFKLAYIDDTYTLTYTGSDLVAGEYTVRLILDENGNYADATFTVGNFNANKVESMKLTTTSETVTYTNGSKITYKVLAVDANGVARDVTKDGNYTLGIDAVAVLGAEKTANGTVTLKNTLKASDKDSVVGTKINLIAASDVYGKLAQTSVTVVDEGVVAGLEFDKTEGQVNKNNVVKATVVDEDGNTMDTVNGQVFAYVVDQSNADAKVDVTAGGNANDGVGSITIFSDKETTVDIVVGIQAKSGDNDSAIYADTLTYTIGKADVNADKLVAMTIGSSDYIVDNDVVAGDAAPYVDSAWRTMVPVRVLAETLGGTVDYTDNVITIVDGDTTVVMTVGEDTYTVNDKEQTMDTAPVIGEGDRAFVPIRFLAEALGYTVTPLQDANGLTASVVFQK